MTTLVLAVDNTELIFKGLIDNSTNLNFVRIVLYAIAGIAAAGFILIRRRSTEPIIPLRFFMNRTFTSIIITTLLFGAAFLGSILYLTQFNQQVFGPDATSSGLMLLPMIGGLVATSAVIGIVITKTWK